MTFPGGGGGGDGLGVGEDVTVESLALVVVDDVTGRLPCGECINAKLA